MFSTFKEALQKPRGLAGIKVLKDKSVEDHPSFVTRILPCLRKERKLVRWQPHISTPNTTLHVRAFFLPLTQLITWKMSFATPCHILTLENARQVAMRDARLLMAMVWVKIRVVLHQKVVSNGFLFPRTRCFQKNWCQQATGGWGDCILVVVGWQKKIVRVFWGGDLSAQMNVNSSKKQRVWDLEKFPIKKAKDTFNFWCHWSRWGLVYFAKRF